MHSSEARLYNIIILLRFFARHYLKKYFFKDQFPNIVIATCGKRGGNVLGTVPRGVCYIAF